MQARPGAGCLRPAANDVREDLYGYLQDAAAALSPPYALRLGGPRLIEDGRVVRLIILGLSVRPAGGQSPLARTPGHSWSVALGPRFANQVRS